MIECRNERDAGGDFLLRCCCWCCCCYAIRNVWCMCITGFPRFGNMRMPAYTTHRHIQRTSDCYISERIGLEPPSQPVAPVAYGVCTGTELTQCATTRAYAPSKRVCVRPLADASNAALCVAHMVAHILTFTTPTMYPKPK